MIRLSLQGRVGLALLAATAVGAGARTAKAEPPSARATPVYVLSLWTDDSDDQADALTQALRSRVRQAQGWSLLETPQSFETLAIALKCPTKPDAPCLQRIADQLHADHYVWGTLARKKGAGEVTADIHLWSRGKGDAETTESYTENLKDAGDESLKQIAAQLLGKVTGGAPSGTLVVHAGTGAGTVFVDGVEKATLEGGVARVDVAGGPHTVTVKVPGFDAQPLPASVPVGQEQDATFTLTPTATSPGDQAAHTPFPTRKVLAYTALVAGAGLLVASGVEAGAWVSDNNASQNDRKQVPSNVTDVCADEVNSAALDACHRSKDATTVSTLSWVFGAAGVALATTGIVLLVTGHDSSDGGRDAVTAGPPKPRVDVLPMLGTRAGAVDLRVTF
ncbi:MAG: hypothetical protein ACRELB_05735 [Polyangiaceae bacterium]